MDDKQIKYFVEAAMLAAGRPLSIDQLQKLFDSDSAPEKSQIRQAISSLIDDYEERGLSVNEVASGFRIQVDAGMAERLEKLWEERPPRYSRALFETLALIAYRQPMTRGEIEEIRGVSVSTNIIRSLLEREWIRIVGHRDVPGRPEMFGTTKRFLDYFGLKKLDDLPPLADISDWESLRVQLNLPAVEEDEAGAPELPGQPESEEPAETAAATEAGAAEEAEPAASVDIPVLYQAGDDQVDDLSAQDIPDIEAALSQEAGLEPIKATEWPNPDEIGETFVRVLDPDEAEVDSGDKEEADASLTRA